MRSFYLTTRACLWGLGVLCYLWGGAAARAQALTDERKAVVLLYNHLKFTFDRDSRHTLLLVWPGLPIPDIANGVSLEDYHILSDLVDSIPKTDTLFRGTAGRVDNQLRYILDNKISAKIELSVVEKKQLQDAFSTLHDPKTGNDTKDYDAYERLLADYDEDIDEVYNDRFTALEKGALTAALEQSLKAREDQLTQALKNNLLYKKIQACLETIDYLTNKDGLAWWYEVRSQFEHQWIASHLGTFPHTEYFPPLEEWENAHGWSKLAISSALVKTFPLEKLPIPEKNVPAVPFISLAGSEKPGNPTFLFSTELKRIEIARPWLEMEIFQNRAWKLDGVVPTTEGLFLHKGASLPDMPLMITGLILARKTQVTLIYPTKAEAETKRNLTAFGPISLASKFLFGKGNLTPKVNITPNAGKYEVVSSSKNIEIIGFLCERIPRSPLPDPKHKF